MMGSRVVGQSAGREEKRKREQRKERGSRGLLGGVCMCEER